MFTALAIVIVAIALGTALGLFGGRQTLLLQPVYAFGFVAALAVVAGDLLPEAAEALGVVALGMFVIGLLVPTVIEAAARHRSARKSQSGEGASVNIGVFALFIHQLGDGAALGGVVGSGAALDVAVAIGAHSIPLVTLMVTLTAQELGVVRAVLRAVVLGVATILGVIATQLVPAADFAVAQPYTSALVAGVLVHLILHAPPSSIVRPVVARLLELFAIAAAITIVVLGGHEESLFAGVVTASFVRLALASAPALLLGLVAAAGMQTMGARLPATWMHGGPRFLQALRGAVIGVPLPVCTCGVLPTARALLERGASPSLIIGFVTAAPILGLDTFLITARLVSPGFAVGRVLAVICVAVAAASVVIRKLKPSQLAIRARVQGPQSFAARSSAVTKTPLTPPWRRAVHHFDELVFHVVPWTVAGLAIASYLDVVLRANAIDARWIDVCVVLAIALPSYVSAAAVTPIAAMLLTKGLSPGAALAGLVIGPATDRATIDFLKRSFGLKATVAALTGGIVTLLVVAFAVNAWATEVNVAIAADSIFARVCTVILVLLGVRSIWQSGIVAWAHALSRTPREEWRVSRAYARV
ncbi:MAG: permease [Clostridia bacterium]|nr:permease [Deltaproteobacteria bacterium]